MYKMQTKISVKQLITCLNSLLFIMFHFIGVSSDAQQIIRGPYLQQSTPHTIIIHWQTDVPCNSKIACGTNFGILNITFQDTNKTTEHVLKIDNLSAGQKYYYNIGTTQQFFHQPQTDHFFYTHPEEGTKTHFRFWVTGDAGWGNNNQRMVRDAFLYFNSGQKLDGWLWLGDNAYYSGLQTEYQNNIFSNNTFENILKNLVVWAAPGNHDYGQNPNNVNPAWIDIFDFPKNGEAGGFPSGTEKYFSWNYGNIHFIQLDSYGCDRSDSGDVADWLKNDLQQNNQTWTIAYWHHPPYTKGNHDSDNLNGWDSELPQIRSGIIPILEKYGVDLVLNGHSHTYERSYLINGHYGYSSSLNDSMKVDTSSGSYPAQCPYQKDTLGGKGNKGTIYAVVGTGGITSGIQPSWPHPVMYRYYNNELGSMLLEVHENKLKTSFINIFAQKKDSFTIVKHMKYRKKIYSCKDSVLIIYPTWHETAVWKPMNITGDSIIINTTHDSIIIANDPLNCLTDTFEIKIIPDSICINSVGIAQIQSSGKSSLIYPNPAHSNEEVNIRFNGNADKLSEIISIEIYDLTGKKSSVLTDFTTTDFNLKIRIPELNKGFYILYLKTKSGTTKGKIVID